MPRTQQAGDELDLPHFEEEVMDEDGLQIVCPPRNTTTDSCPCPLAWTRFNWTERFGDSDADRDVARSVRRNVYRFDLRERWFARRARSEE